MTLMSVRSVDDHSDSGFQRFQSIQKASRKLRNHQVFLILFAIEFVFFLIFEDPSKQIVKNLNASTTLQAFDAL